MRHSKMKCFLFAIGVLTGLGAFQADPAGSAKARPGLAWTRQEALPRQPGRAESTPIPGKKEEADCDDCVIVRAPAAAGEPAGVLARTLWGLFWVLGPGGRRKAKTQDPSTAAPST
jgi:hypothetical protein